MTRITYAHARLELGEELLGRPLHQLGVGHAARWREYQRLVGGVGDL